MYPLIFCPSPFNGKRNEEGDRIMGRVCEKRKTLK